VIVVFSCLYCLRLKIVIFILFRIFAATVSYTIIIQSML